MNSPSVLSCNFQIFDGAGHFSISQSSPGVAQIARATQAVPLFTEREKSRRPYRAYASQGVQSISFRSLPARFAAGSSYLWRSRKNGVRSSGRLRTNMQIADPASLMAGAGNGETLREDSRQNSPHISMLPPTRTGIWPAGNCPTQWDGWISGIPYAGAWLAIAWFARSRVRWLRRSMSSLQES